MFIKSIILVIYHTNLWQQGNLSNAQAKQRRRQHWSCRNIILAHCTLIQVVFFNWPSPENVSTLAPPQKCFDWPPPTLKNF